ncbi:hypothetical protein, partial [Bordetella pseudohinzii]
PALKFVFANDDRLEVGLEGLNTLQDILNAIAGSVMVNKDGQPIRIAAEGPNAGRPLPDSDTTTAWDYLYALDASLSADGRLVVAYSQAARDAGYGGEFRLEPGTLITLDDQGNVSQSATVLSEAAKWLGLLGASQSFRDSANGVLTGDALAAGHSTRFMLAGSNATIRSGGGSNSFLVSYGYVAADAWERFSTGAGNNILTQAGGYNTLRVDSVYGAVLTSSQVSYLNGGTFTNAVNMARAGGGGAAMDNVTLAARNAAGTATTLDAENWTGRLTLESDGGYNTLKGNKSNVSFIVVQPVNVAGGSVTVSLAASGGSGNTLQLISPVTGTAVLSSLMGAAGNLFGVNLGTNAQNLERILDLGEDAVIDVDVTTSGTDVTIRAGTLQIKKNITLDSTHLLRLEAQDIRIGTVTTHIVLAAGAIEVLAQRYRPWRSAYGQIFDLSTSVTITNATLSALDAAGAGVTISAKLDSSQYDLDPLVKNAEADTGLRAKLGAGVNSIYDALMPLLDSVAAEAAWARVKYSASINIDASTSIISASDVSIKAGTKAQVKLSPLIAKIVGVGVGVLENNAEVTVNGKIYAAGDISVLSEVDNEMTISLLPSTISKLPGVVGVGIGIVNSSAKVTIGNTAELMTGVNVSPGGVISFGGAGGDVTVQAITKHKTDITVSASGAMAESDDTKPVKDPAAPPATGPAQEKGRYNASYAKVGAALGLAINNISTEVVVNGKLTAGGTGDTTVPDGANKVIVQALTLDQGSKVAVKTSLGGRQATGVSYVDQTVLEAKSLAGRKIGGPVASGAVNGFGVVTQNVKAFFSALRKD